MDGWFRTHIMVLSLALGEGEACRRSYSSRSFFHLSKGIDNENALDMLN